MSGFRIKRRVGASGRCREDDRDGDRAECSEEGDNTKQVGKSKTAHGNSISFAIIGKIKVIDVSGSSAGVTSYFTLLHRGITSGL